eukprot:2249835-Prymnesium_polylepis.1
MGGNLTLCLYSMWTCLIPEREAGLRREGQCGMCGARVMRVRRIAKAQIRPGRSGSALSRPSPRASALGSSRARSNVETRI